MIADLHNDILVEKRCFYRGNKNAVVGAVWTSKLDKPLEVLQWAKRKAKYRAIEDLGFIEKKDFKMISDFAPVYASLTWNEQNALAGGAFSDGGLTDWGKEVVDFLFENGISLDMAHLNKRSFFETAEYIDKKGFISKPLNDNSKVLCSHTCFDGIFSHKRNLTDEQIKAVISFDGVIGLTLVPQFMGNDDAGADDVIKQIEYFLQRFDYKHLGLGTDFFGVERTAVKDYPELEKLKIRLIKMGLCEKKMDAIFFENVMRFLAPYS